VALFHWQYSSLPVVLGFGGACALLYGSLLLVREARLALLTTVEELAFVREAVLEKNARSIKAEARLNGSRRKNNPLFYTIHVAAERVDGIPPDQRESASRRD
jgi:hypothetical protein